MNPAINVSVDQVLEESSARLASIRRDRKNESNETKKEL